MAGYRPKRLLVGVAGVLVGLALGMGYGHVQLQGQQKAHQAKIREINQRLSQAQRKYVQGMAAQAGLEEEKQQGLAEAEGLRKEKEGLAAENRTLKSRADSLASLAASLEEKRALSEARAVSQESKNRQTATLLTKTEADRNGLEQKQRQTSQALQEREKELKVLIPKYDRCVENNVRLYHLGDELIRQYQDKGLMRTLAQKEPFTQIKKVELEKLVQDYRDKIDQQKFGSK